MNKCATIHTPCDKSHLETTAMHNTTSSSRHMGACAIRVLEYLGTYLHIIIVGFNHDIAIVIIMIMILLSLLLPGSPLSSRTLASCRYIGAGLGSDL